MAKYIWRTKEGKEMLIRDMEDSHLINAINLIWRNRQKVKEAAVLEMIQAISTLNGDMATFYAEQDLCVLEETSAEEFVMQETKLNHLWTEARTRGLFEKTSVPKRYWYSDLTG